MSLATQVMVRAIEMLSAASAAYVSLSRKEQRQIDRVIELLKYSPKDRPSKLSVFKSAKLPNHFIVRVTADLRLIYNRPQVYQVVIKDLYRRTSARGVS